MATSPFSEEVEIFRDIRTQLMMNTFSGAGSRPALAVATNVGDGKTFVAANLAVAFSQLAGRTLLLDADMRTPRLHQIFRLDNSEGLTNILTGRSEVKIQPVPELQRLYLLPVGAIPPNPTELIQRPAFDILLRELRSKFDYVIVDTPSASCGSDARLVASRCGAALIVGRKNSTRAPDLHSFVDKLRKDSLTLVGELMNDC